MPGFMQKPQSSALAFLVAGAVWFVIGTLYGAVSAIHFVSPEFFSNIPFLTFSRERPAHVNTVIFGFATGTLIGGTLYWVPALLRTRLWSERLAWASFFLWTATVLSGPITFAFGLTQGREYAEYIWPFDVTITLAILLLVFNFVMTIAGRAEKGLYVSVWYAMGALIWTAFCYPIGNVMWRPYTGALPGLLDSIFLWFWGHNLVGLLLTPLAVGASFFIIPRVVRGPLYSHTLGLVGFWTLVAIYAHIGGHHIIQAPIPNWLKTISVVDSVAMIVPVFTVLVNMWLTARGRGGLMWRDPAGRYVLFGNIWYLVTCIQGPVQSLPSVQRITHFSNWTVGHAHIAVLGFAAFISLGALWHVLPLITGRRLWSVRLVHLQFGLVLTGVTGFFVVLTAAGLIQGQAWYNGETVYRVLPEMAIYMIARLVFGIFIISSAFLGLFVVLMTIYRGAPFNPADEEESAPIEEGRP